MSKTKKDSIWDKMFMVLWFLGIFSIFLFLIFLFFKNIYVRSVLSLILSYGFFELARTTYKDSIKDDETDENKNDSIFTLSQLLVIFNQSVSQREVSLLNLDYEKVSDIPTQDESYTDCFCRFDSFFYSSNNVLKCDILKSNLFGSDNQIILYNNLTDQVVNAGFRKSQEKPHGNSYIITYKKGNVQIDFFNSDISVSVSIYYVDRYFIGNLIDLNRKEIGKKKLE